MIQELRALYCFETIDKNKSSLRRALLPAMAVPEEIHQPSSAKYEPRILRNALENAQNIALGLGFSEYKFALTGKTEQ